ncbi:receptor-like protein EIX1 [Salvia divinorum]|uniref:Receptor-like protein EIX1 n=1 Tax=Salvia divinorum TaxID=28513 RepID=A0ABD1HKX1_SALDI
MSVSNPSVADFLFLICLRLSNAIFCPLIEQQSLVNLKNSVVDPYNHLSSWNNVNCCKWKGVICNNSTGHVHRLRVSGLSLRGQINPSLVNLSHLTHLDLSLNNFNQTIPSFIASLINLEYLNLSFAGFHGKIPHNIGNLTRLRSLDLAGFPNMVCGDHLNHYHSIHLAGYPEMEYVAAVTSPNLLHVDTIQWLSQLEVLNMNFVNLSKAQDWLQVINTLPSLQKLRFQNCSLVHISPLNYLNITSLTLIDLSSNNFHSLEVPTWILGLENLRYLDLRNNSFVGPIPTSCNATKLKYIDISSNFLKSTVPSWLYHSCMELEFIYLDFNFLHGTIPKQFTHLCKIRTLSLSFNRFQGTMFDSFGNMSKCFLEALEELNLQFNQLSGPLIDQLGEFRSLERLFLNKNSFSGTIPRNLGKLSSSLQVLGLSRNKLTGGLPDSLGQLCNLERLHIGGNNLKGDVRESLFANLTHLKILTASQNELSLRLDEHWSPPFQLKQLRLGSWSVSEGSQIPSWILRQKNLSAYLDLSDTGIFSDNVPSWFWQIQFLNLSHNHLHGNIPDIRGSTEYQYVYASSNQFEGSLPRVGDRLRELDLSNNSFSGGIAHFLCDDTYDTYSLEILHLGDNQLNGKLPDCWMKWPSLKYLNIGNNQMFGSIPASIGLLANLLSLNLHNNKFSGRIPFSMHNCKKMLKMGLADNNLGGNIPTWIGTSLVELWILILRSNNLSGEISSDLCQLSYLQILDLSDNKLSGVIPRCVHNFTAMAVKKSLPDLYKLYGGEKSIYSFSIYIGGFIESALIVLKRSKLQYDTILPLVTTIDFSNNNLYGDIPTEVTYLLELGSLNLSRNELVGLVPDHIGEMKQLESLDLSRNSLRGEIPNSLALLSFLEYLDLSYNNLTGRIPQSTQLQSFNATSFTGNHLCGPPLTANCSNKFGEEKEEKDKGGEIEWLDVFFCLGYSMGFSMVCSVLALSKRWRDAYFGLVERMWNKLCVCVIVKWRRITSL